MKLHGAFTALVTPFDASQALDIAALDRLVDAQIQAGIAGLVPCGTTGESPTLSDDEHYAVVSRVVAKAHQRVPVIAGAGSNSTAHAVHLAKRSVAAGADAVMVVMPYYNKPSQAGLVLHCVTVAHAVGVPIVLYNVPGRSACDLLAESVEQICAAAGNVVAIKEATGNVLRAQALARRLGDRLTILSGDDALTLPMMAVGARGVISVTSNVLPAAVQRVTALALDNRWDDARRAHLALLPVHDVMFIESNPGPAKSAMAAAGALEPIVRAPLVMPSESSRAKVAAVMSAYNEATKAGH